MEGGKSERGSGCYNRPLAVQQLVGNRKKRCDTEFRRTSSSQHVLHHLCVKTENVC